MLEELALWESEVKGGRGEVDHINWWAVNHHNYKVLPTLVGMGNQLEHTAVRGIGLRLGGSVSLKEISWIRQELLLLCLFQKLLFVLVVVVMTTQAASAQHISTYVLAKKRGRGEDTV